MRRTSPALLATAALVLAACSGAPGARADSPAADAAGAGTATASGQDATGEHAKTPVSAAPFTVTRVATFNEPWAIEFVPGTPYALITEKAGKLKLWQADGAVVDVAGVPSVAYGGQGGLGDVIVGAMNESGHDLYLSWVETDAAGNLGAVVGRGTLSIDRAGGPAIVGLKPIWRQVPFVSGRGHYSHRLAISPDGQHLFVASGERQKFDPAQDMKANLGKIVRLTRDGQPAAGNPFADQGGVAAEVWTLGQRNILGLDFDARGRLWAQEMGPKHGDELNLITAGKNFGYPIVSNGDHYDGRDIPDHPTRPEFAAPALWWNPAISPAGLVWFDGSAFPAWKDSLFIGALSGKGLVRVQLDGKGGARKADYWDMNTRIRDVEQGPDGKLWLLTDGKSGELQRLDPK